MFKLPQETTALKDYNHKRTAETIHAEMVSNKGGVVPLNFPEVDGDPIEGCYYVTPVAKTVPPFNIPISFTLDSKSASQSTEVVPLCMDFRGLMREGRLGSVVSNEFQYKFNASMLKLTKLWVEGEFSTIINFNQEALLRLFTRWVGTALIAKLNIPEENQPLVNILTAWYFYCLCYPTEETIPAHKLPRLTTLIARATFVNPTLVGEVIEQLPFVTDINGYIELLKNFSQTSRFEQVTPGFIFALVVYSWYGPASAELSTVALESPPIFLSLVYGSIRFDNYRGTQLGQLTKHLKTQEKATLQTTVEQALVSN